MPGVYFNQLWEAKYISRIFVIYFLEIMYKKNYKRDLIPIAVIFAAICILLLIPPAFPEKIFPDTERIPVRVISTDETFVVDTGLIRSGEQLCEVEILKGRFKNQVFEATNILSGSLEKDKIFIPGDKALATLDYEGDKITVITLVDHYRINYEIILVAVFVLFLVIFAGSVGLKAIFSFIFTILTIWKIMLPMFLNGFNPISVGLIISVILTTAIIGLVFGIDKKSLAAISGSLLGLLVTCLMSIFFVAKFKIHGAVIPYSESLLYAGFAKLSLTNIFIASIFIASSGAVMDLAVDITSSVSEVTQKRPDISRLEAIKSGMSVGRNVLGTMTTTLLLAYSGGYIGLIMVFMAQGTPLINIFNLNYVSSEILHTIIGSFGLVTVAPFTAITSGLLLADKK